MTQEKDRIFLQNAIGVLGLAITEDQVAGLMSFADLLIKWNKIYNLTAITAPSEVLTKHILDSLSLVPYLSNYLGKSSEILDVGSGGGLPAIPCAILLPKVNFNLVDPVEKKARFLQQAIITLKLKNTKIFNDRVENLRVNQKFKVATCRAFSSLKHFVEATETLVCDDGYWLAMKGKIPEEEIKDIPPGIRLESCHELKIPFLEGKRHLVVLKKEVCDGEKASS